MTKDFADFLESLNSEGAVYVVIGGIAVLSHIPYRTTRDLDVLIEPSLENAAKVRRAVAQWGRFEPEYQAEEFIAGDILSFGGLLRVEVHSRVPGADWNEVWEGRSTRSSPSRGPEGFAAGRFPGMTPQGRLASAQEEAGIRERFMNGSDACIRRSSDDGPYGA